MWSGQMAGGRAAAGSADRSCKQVFFFLFAGISLLGWSLPALSADDYLSELDAEVKKVEARTIDGETGRDVVEAPAEAAPVEPTANTGVSRADFERQLREHYLGTFGFYKKLPERSREEVFEEYRRGADMGQLRKKIIDRLLQH